MNLLRCDINRPEAESKEYDFPFDGTSELLESPSLRNSKRNGPAPPWTRPVPSI